MRDKHHSRTYKTSFPCSDTGISPKKMKQKIYGKLTDSQGRCIHYNSPLDIIANKCGICKKFYACYKCHDETENHTFGAVAAFEKETVMCGVCGQKFSYAEYSKLTSCPKCSSLFNPKCSLHCKIYKK